MRIGLKLHHSGPGATPDLIRRWALFAELLGMHFLMIGDHVALTPDVTEKYPSPFFEACTTLTWLAAQTHTIGLGTPVLVCPYHHPLRLAQLTANIDALANGRLIVGVGVGWAQGEFEALNIPFEHRGAITDKSVPGRKFLGTHLPASNEALFVNFGDVPPDQKPVQHPPPPLWIG